MMGNGIKPEEVALEIFNNDTDAVVSKMGAIAAKWAQEGAKLGDCGKMCHDCAFRVQEDINYYGDTVQSAMEYLAYGGGSMNCHTPEYGDAGKPCVGFLYAKQYADSLNK